MGLKYRAFLQPNFRICRWLLGCGGAYLNAGRRAVGRQDRVEIGWLIWKAPTLTSANTRTLVTKKLE